MKKTLVSALTTALVVGAASTTFAAANPFSDVPADHWAYDAVSTLAADGVIEGYGDSAFKGDKNITRYEMAQMVAKAMAKTNVGGNDKALIDKLAAEFADELNNLGVRVANLERNADMVKWNGEARYTFTKEMRDTKADKSTNEALLRLEPSAEVNSNWHVKARLDASNDVSKDTSNTVSLKRIWAQGDYKNFSVSLGKFPDATAYDKSMMLNNQMSGAAVTFGNKLKATVMAGRISSEDSKILAEDTANMQSLALNYAQGKASATAAYYNLTGIGDRVPAYSNDEDQKAGIWELAGTYRFSKNVALTGAYANNSKAENFKKAGIVQLDYKGAQKANKGSWGAYLAYRHLGQYAVVDPNTDGVGYNQKGWEIGTQYTLMKNVQAKAIYFKGKQLDNDKDASKLFGRVEFFF